MNGGAPETGSGDATLVTPDAVLGVWSMLLDGKACAEASIMQLTSGDGVGVAAGLTVGVVGAGMFFCAFFLLGILFLSGD